MFKDMMPYKEFTIDGLTIKMYEPHDHVVRGVPLGWEAGTLRVWTDELNQVDGKMVLDVGAYTGIYTMLAIAANKRVMAFEPLQPVYSRLVENIYLNDENPSFISFMVGLSDTEQKTKIHVTGNNPLPSGSSVDPHPSRQTLTEFPIQLMTWDQHQNINSVGLIKMDVERHEMAALRGMKKMLTRDRPTLIIELLTVEEAHEVFDFMAECGYNEFAQIDEDSDEEYPYNYVTSELHIGPRTTNFLIKA